MNQFITKAKDFFRSIGKLSASLFFAALGVVVIVYAYNAIGDAYQKKKNEKYEAVREWSYDLNDIGFIAKAKTKVVNGSLFVQLNFEGYPAYLTHPSLSQKNQNAEFILNFTDADNFELFDQRIKISNFTTVEVGGKPEGLRYQFTVPISTATYEKFSNLSIGWTFETKIPEIVQPAARSPKGDKPISSDSTDHCAPGLSRSERMRRLALNGTVRENAKESYSVGSKSVMFSWDGSVLLCS